MSAPRAGYAAAMSDRARRPPRRAPLRVPRVRRWGDEHRGRGL